MPNNHPQRGFTLVELMIVVAIIGILASIVYPSYLEYVKRTNRTEATQLLIDIANRQQQYLMDARSYASSLDELNITASDRFDEHYTLEIETGDAPPSFTLTASPSSSLMTGDVEFTLDDTGAKTPADKWK